MNSSAKRSLYLIIFSALTLFALSSAQVRAAEVRANKSMPLFGAVGALAPAFTPIPELTSGFELPIPATIHP
jgi:hypothetical protein